jgi:hypothetical protein
MTDRTGHCLCGAVSFTAREMEDTFSTCYCDMCQRWAGGPFSGVSVKTENLEIEGHAHIGTVQSSGFAQRSFCTKCGASLWYKLTAGQYVGNTSISVGLLDNRTGLTVKTEYFVDYKDSTNQVPADIEQYSQADVEKMIASFTGNTQS